MKGGRGEREESLLSVVGDTNLGMGRCGGRGFIFGGFLLFLFRDERGAGFVMVMHDANNHGDETRKQPRENFEGVCHQ